MFNLTFLLTCVIFSPGNSFNQTKNLNEQFLNASQFHCFKREITINDAVIKEKVTTGAINVLAGNSIVAHYDTDGTLDNTYGVNGIQTTDFAATAMTLESDGKLYSQVMAEPAIRAYNLILQKKDKADVYQFIKK